MAIVSGQVVPPGATVPLKMRHLKYILCPLVNIKGPPTEGLSAGCMNLIVILVLGAYSRIRRQDALPVLHR